MQVNTCESFELKGQVNSLRALDLNDNALMDKEDALKPFRPRKGLMFRGLMICIAQRFKFHKSKRNIEHAPTPKKEKHEGLTQLRILPKSKNSGASPILMNSPKEQNLEYNERTKIVKLHKVRV